MQKLFHQGVQLASKTKDLLLSRMKHQLRPHQRVKNLAWFQFLIFQKEFWILPFLPYNLNKEPKLYLQWSFVARPQKIKLHWKTASTSIKIHILVQRSFHFDNLTSNFYFCQPFLINKSMRLQYRNKLRKHEQLCFLLCHWHLIHPNREFYLRNKRSSPRKPRR